MGINISVKKVLGREMADNWSFTQSPYYKTEDEDWFDCGRRSGDADFVVENDWVCVDDDEGNRELRRPKDFEKARQWVKENISKEGQPRLLEALDKMEKDETLAFRWSW